MIKIILAVLCFVNVAIAQDAPTAGSYRDFSGGVNTYNASVSLPANESPNLMNVVIDEGGALSQRNGYQSCGTIPGGATATNLYEYSKNDGSRNLIVTDNVSIWQTADCVVYSTITTGLSSLSMPRFATVLDKLWTVNGSTYPFTWDGSTLYRLDGLDNHPEAPKGKYITYWKSRVWIGNTPTAPSSLFFSLLVDNLGNILSPETSTGAWTSTNQIYINRDDGSPLYGMKPYRDNLYAFKETGITRVVFESEYSLSVAKNVTTIGSKFNESIVEMDDGLLRFVGRDGVYAFDGSTVKRISTRWTPTFETIRQPSQSEQYHLWDSNTDWANGNLDINVISTSGALSLGYEDFADLNYIKNPVWVSKTYANSVDNTLFTSTNGYIEGIGNNGYLETQSSEKNNWYFDFNISSYAAVLYIMPMGHIVKLPSTEPPTVSGYLIKIENITNNCKMGLLSFSSNTVNTLITYPFPKSFSNFTGWTTVHLNRTDVGIFTMSIGTYSVTTTSPDVSFTSSTLTALLPRYNRETYFDNFSYVKKSTGVYTASITTATNVSVWKTFAVDETLNGQSIAYDIRTATSVYNTLQAPWRPITSGAVVSTTTDAYAQWRATFGTTDNGVSPLLNTASIGWMTGGSSKSALTGINYKSRYWLSASTSIANQYNDLVMVESKSPLGTHTRYDLPISAFTLWNNNLYGAISNTAKIARLDYGSTDDGNAIISYWDSRDEMYDNPILYKTINLGILDYANSPANTNIQIGLSPDMGENWEYKSFNMSASTLPRNTKRLNYKANTSLGFRTRIFNDTLGIGFKIYGIHNFGKMTQFAGN